MHALLALLAACGLTFPSVPAGALAAPPAQEDPAHQELRATRDGILTAMRARDLDALLGYLHPDVVVTWQNAEVSRGPAGFAEYYKRMMSGPESIVAALEMDTKVDELSILHGDDTAIAFGSSADRFELRSGLEFALNSRWSATLVKKDGRWLVASLHASTDLFDNALLDRAKSMLVYGSGVALALGLGVGFFVGRRRGGR